MSYTAPERLSAKPLRWVVRLVLALLSLLSLITAVIVSPYVMLVIGMSFDAPGAEWGRLHLPVLALPILLLSLAASAAWAAFSSRVRLLWAVSASLIADLTVLVGLWISV